MLPNILTIGRILLTPLFILCLFYEAPWSKVSALGIFIFASVTDAFDGHIARKRNLVTKTGEFLDPLADKILVVSAFLSFALLDKIPFWMVVLIVFRDLFVTGLRMLFLNNGISLVTSKISKAKTGAQITAIIFVLSYLSLKTLSFVDASQLIVFIDSFNLIWIIVFSATIFTVYTGLHYLYINRASIEAFIEHSSDGA
ncbi:MAG TPA: CDP-diacylglycerol--glycerol-3-phosphate 3-phosphatidyltransferase [Candidatus Marinimicrobia bacterium]|nr:CDP-diacylglycerol--glycerol-3-phosphate 3-phosphatidyltransferase [Candidatus Neomarinimicrobiota bacterium]